MADPKIKRHFIVTAFIPNSEGLGASGAIVDTIYTNLEEAKLKAKQMAAASPGSTYVVYSALWYSFTDETPVNLERVIGSVSTS